MSQQIEVVEESANEKESKRKVAMLLSCIGDEGLNIYNTFQLVTYSKKHNLNKVLDKFKEYCALKKNFIFERYLLNGILQI